jgi:hypothetical protein
MPKQEEYRDHAMTALKMAQRQPEAAEKSRLLAMAEAWLDLADRAARSPLERLRRVLPRDEQDGASAETERQR